MPVQLKHNQRLNSLRRFRSYVETLTWTQPVIRSWVHLLSASFSVEKRMKTCQPRCSSLRSLQHNHGSHRLTHAEPRSA